MGQYLWFIIICVTDAWTDAWTFILTDAWAEDGWNYMCNSILPNHTRVTWKKELYFSMCSVVYYQSFARTCSVLNRIMLRVLRILFFSTHPLKIAKFTEMRKSNVLALLWMMWDTLMLKLIAKKNRENDSFL
jgi:hypothetical protein